ncbi:EAL domain-containing protein [Luteimonas sp. RD2P54]|uniref:EAL domain-containing protein n=1 Tax=Luteimonas endophytica TaxID=3042023 RepID=A0ABT6JBJ9_9GAMM|nr:EAL domain-containing protein [Luteimonas endophytica]MDH5823955.1 EAL domain-containing protein [Luteimonas endophytica]
MTGSHAQMGRLGRSATTTSVVTAAAALLVAGALITTLQFLTLRRDFVGDIRAQVGATAANSAGAVVFDDAEAGAEALAALRALPGLRAAAILRNDGTRLSGFERDGRAAEAPPTPRLTDAGLVRVDLRELAIAEPIALDGRRVGTLVVRMGLDRLYGRVGSFVLMFLLVGLGALALSVLLMSRMRRQVHSAELQLDRMAHYDPITGLLNRNAFNAQLDARLHDRGEDCRLGLLLLDVDGFKTVNDTLGHHQGDALLGQIAARLRAALRQGDTVYRVGGDEFAIVLVPLESAAEADAFGRRVLAQFQQPFPVADHELHITVSCGIGLAPRDAADLHALTSHADTALYQAKRNGRNGFELFRPEMNQRNEQRLRLRAELRKALDHDALELAYQPQLAIASDRVVGFEALARWNHPELGPISPAEFIPVAEESGLILPLGRWVIRAACRQMAQWQAQGLAGFRVAVNVSARQLRDAQLPEFIDATLVAHRLAPERLELEITESLLLDNAETHIALLRRLRARGIRLSIDDFGTGFSSMAYLPRLPLDQLKIDGSFVRAIPGDGEAITTAIIAMAHHLRLEVVAEGVEDAVQFEYLRRAGCDVMQGYLLSRPLAPEQATAFLHRHVAGVDPLAAAAPAAAALPGGR